MHFIRILFALYMTFQSVAGLASQIPSKDFEYYGNLVNLAADNPAVSRKQALVYEREYQWRVDVRIGLAQGNAVVGNFGSRRRSDYSALGPSIDLARKLDNCALPNQILASAIVCSMLPEADCLWQGKIQLEGSTAQIDYFALTKTAQAVEAS